MIVRRFYEESLAQASYLVGCAATGEALIIDPNRDIQQYLDAAAGEGLRIAAVTETHIHADYLSGSRALARQAGARLYVSAEGGPAWQYTCLGEPGVVALHDGDSFAVGNLRIDAVHTPGHTPEHLSFVLTDRPAGAQPVAAFTGDFIFAGDVGRPDLLERAAGYTGTMAEAARTLHASLGRFTKAYGDGLLLWPGHGAGSACGKQLGGVPVTSLGYERQTNWALQVREVEAFVVEVLAGQPEPPHYFAAMKRLNREGSPPIDRASTLPRVETVASIPAIDVRPREIAVTTPAPHAIGIPLDRQFLAYAGSVLRPAGPYTIVAERQRAADAAARQLMLIGIETSGWILPADTGTGAAPYETIAPALAEERAEAGVDLVDVRSAVERARGTIAGSRHVPLGDLPEAMARRERDRPIAVFCQSGARSHIAATLLAAMGFTHVENLAGGYAGWLQSRSAPLPAAIG